MAYSIDRFCHGDLFTKNVLLDRDLKPIITDLERAHFDSFGQQFWMDMTDLFDNIIRHVPILSNEGGVEKIIQQNIESEGM